MTARAQRAADRLAKALLLAPFAAGMFIYGSTKPPHVVERGIKLTRCEATARWVDLAWEAEDARIVRGETAFCVQAARAGGVFEDVAETTNTSARVPGFWVGGATRWRIKADVSPSAVAEEGAE